MTSKEAQNLMEGIAARAIAEFSELCEFHNRGTLVLVLMDVSCVHRMGAGLRLRELLEASAPDFAHDLAGIFRHLNRREGRFEEHFHPRFAL